MSFADQPLDFTDSALYDDPWELYRWLRDESPMHRDEGNDLLGGVPPRRPGRRLAEPRALLLGSRGCARRVRRSSRCWPWMIPSTRGCDSLVNKGFTPRQVRAILPHVRELSAELAREVADRGEVDFVEEGGDPRSPDRDRRADGARPRHPHAALPLVRRHDGRRRAHRPRRPHHAGRRHRLRRVRRGAPGPDCRAARAPHRRPDRRAHTRAHDAGRPRGAGREHHREHAGRRRAARGARAAAVPRDPARGGQRDHPQRHLRGTARPQAASPTSTLGSASASTTRPSSTSRSTS